MYNVCATTSSILCVVHPHTRTRTRTRTHTPTPTHTHTHTHPHTQGGIVLLLAGVCLCVVQRNTGRKLSVEIGGFKRLQALSVTLTAVLLLPWAAIQLVSQDIPLLSLHSIGALCAVGLTQLADFYVTTIATQRVDPAQMGRVSSLLSFSVAVAMATLSWYSYPVEEHGLSVGVVMATIFFLLATAILTRPNPRSSSFSLIGYSSAGLPLYSAHRSMHLSYSSLVSLVREGVGRIMDDTNSRRIFYFLLLNLVGVVSCGSGCGLVQEGNSQPFQAMHCWGHISI